jgi:glycosyltransferase involved in cell wall biosynthesis
MKISVITASFNSAGTIVDTLDSVAAQRHPDIEHLVIDGASRDNTVALVRAHKRPPELCVSEQDRGIYDAMNKGIRLATGDVIGFINSDDFYASPDALTKVAEVFDNPSVDICYGNLCYVRHDHPDQVVRYWPSCPFRPGLFRTGWCPPHPTFFVRRHVYEKLGGFDLSYRMANDVELMARFLEVHRVSSHFLPELLVSMRMGGASNHRWSAILLQNREIWRAMKAHQMRPALFPFVFGKLLSRGRQFLSRPA